MRNFSGGRSFNKFDRGSRPSMHHAVCDACGRDCEVPFKPSGDKPIYCSECFQDKGDSSRGRRDDRRDDRRDGRRDDRHSGSSFRDREKKMFQAVCDTCGRDCEVPFKPTAGKPIFCDACFEKPEGGKGKSGGAKNDLGALNEKLDKILTLLSYLAPVKMEAKKEDKKVAPKKIEKKEKVEVKAPKAKTVKKVAAKKTNSKKKK